jgi:hypothetical protein
MKEKSMTYRIFVLINLVVGIAPAVASATGFQTPPDVISSAVPEPTGAVLFAVGLAAAAISIRMIRRK